MMRLFRNALVATLISLSTCSTACTREVPVATPVPAPSCNPGPIPPFPRLAVEKCSDGDVRLVCMSPADAAAIWAWARDVGRWSERASVCTDNSDAPLPLVSRPTPAVVDLLNLATKLEDPRVDIDVAFIECDYPNAYYWPASRQIEICTSLFTLEPGALRFILAHEIAHAYIVQLDVPFTGLHEAAADELAAFLLIRAGHTKDLLDASWYWLTLGKTQTVAPWAEHPGNEQRYHTLRCLYYEATNAPAPLCRHDLARVTRHWTRLLQPSAR